MIDTKQQALNLFEINRAEFLECARWIARKIAGRQGNVTIDDVRKEIKVPLNLDSRVLGAVFNTDEWVKAGYAQTKIKTSHGRVVTVWNLRLNNDSLSEFNDLIKKQQFETYQGKLF